MHDGHAKNLKLEREEMERERNNEEMGIDVNRRLWGMDYGVRKWHGIVPNILYMHLMCSGGGRINNEQ
jgi:hypothetical protein